MSQQYRLDDDTPSQEVYRMSINLFFRDGIVSVSESHAAAFKLVVGPFMLHRKYRIETPNKGHSQRSKI